MIKIDVKAVFAGTLSLSTWSAKGAIIVISEDIDPGHNSYRHDAFSNPIIIQRISVVVLTRLCGVVTWQFLLLLFHAMRIVKIVM